MVPLWSQIRFVISKQCQVVSKKGLKFQFPAHSTLVTCQLVGSSVCSVCEGYRWWQSRGFVSVLTVKEGDGVCRSMKESSCAVPVCSSVRLTDTCSTAPLLLCSARLPLRARTVPVWQCKSLHSPQPKIQLQYHTTLATTHSSVQCSHSIQWHAATMAIHTNVGLGDFILMEQINMEEFAKNLKIRCGPSYFVVWWVRAELCKVVTNGQTPGDILFVSSLVRKHESKDLSSWDLAGWIFPHWNDVKYYPAAAKPRHISSLTAGCLAGETSLHSVLDWGHLGWLQTAGSYV